MSHFMFYAGKAYKYKIDGEKYPAGKALKDGLLQELSDVFSQNILLLVMKIYVLISSEHNLERTYLIRILICPFLNN